jgi:hypothetical protein
MLENASSQYKHWNTEIQIIRYVIRIKEITFQGEKICSKRWNFFLSLSPLEFRCTKVSRPFQLSVSFILFKFGPEKKQFLLLPSLQSGQLEL